MAKSASKLEKQLAPVAEATAATASVGAGAGVGATTSASVDDGQMTIWMRYRFVVLLSGAILIALVLTVVSMVIYSTSGAAQLDLSRPGYRSVSSKVEKEDTTDTFSASGPVNKDTINQFLQLYDTQAAKTKSVDAFNGDPLNPDVLEFGSSGN